MSNLVNNMSKYLEEKSKPPIFNVKDGILYGFTDKFIDFVNENFVINMHCEERRLRAQQSLLGDKETDIHERLKLFTNCLKDNFSQSEHLEFSIDPNLGFPRVDIHLENPDLRIEKVAVFPEFIKTGKRKNYELPEPVDAIDYHMTGEQVTSSELDKLFYQGQTIIVTGISGDEELQTVCEHWTEATGNHLHEYMENELRGKPTAKVFTINQIVLEGTAKGVLLISRKTYGRDGQLPFLLTLKSCVLNSSEIEKILVNKLPNASIEKEDLDPNYDPNNDPNDILSSITF